MLIDVTLRITPKMVKDAQGNEKKALVGHLGTHFDVMDKEFPLEYVKRKAICFDAKDMAEVTLESVNFDLIEKDMFVVFATGFIEQEGYGGKNYFKGHPHLSNAVIDKLLGKGVSLIGIDCAGIRGGHEHTSTDQKCADRGTFVIENLCSLDKLPKETPFIMHTYPMNYEGMSGLPCRVVAETEEE